MLSNAKNEIPLWHFDEQIGRWLEEGVAFLDGDKYIGEVSHFSWWNCDDPFLATNLCVNVIQLRNNTPLENQLVVLITESWGIASDYTDENGVVCGLIPSDLVITLQIWDECGNVVYSIEIGPFTDPTNEITIQINDQSIDYFTVSGTVTDCTGVDPLTNTYIKAISDFGSFYTTTDENGDYYLEGVFCEESDLIITAIDAVAGLSGFSTITDLDSDDYQVDLTLCEESPFIVLEEDGVAVFTSSFCEAKLKPHELLIYDENGSNFIMGVVGANGADTYQANLLYPNQIAEEGNLTVTITSFGAIGGIIKGTFTGTTAVNNSINGSFVALRVE
jgi:hypothetical protein